MADQAIGSAHQEHADTPPLYQIRLDLEGAHPPIWRRLLLPADLPLDTVHVIIQVAMGWTDSHLHMFTSDGREFGDVSFDDYDMDMLDETQFVLSGLLRKVGDQLGYEYDFGDGWTHVLKLEKILPQDPEVIYPICLTGRRACPPEDVGGIGGYDFFLDAMADETHPEHEEYAEWYGAEFDPEDFDPEATTEALQDMMAELYDDGIAPHPITMIRWQMLSPELVDQIPYQALTDLVGPPDAAQRRWARRIRRAKSASEVLDLLPIDHPALIGEWMEQVVAFSPGIARLAADRLAELDSRHTEHRAWIQERLICALQRLGSPAAQALMEVFEALDDYSKALACVALGRLEEHDAGDTIWRHFVLAYETPETGLFLGPLWALVDLADSRAADAIAQVLEDDWDYDELAAMAGRAGDQRSLLPLIDWMALDPDEPSAEAAAAVTLVAHRIGREAVIRVLKSRPAPESDSPGFTYDIIVDHLLSIPVEAAETTFTAYFTPTTIESVMANLLDDDLAPPGPFFDPEWYFEEEMGDDVIDLDDELSFGPGITPLTRLTPRRPAPHFGPLPNRNEPCWCGSGKKYKHCHWREDQQKDIPQAA